MKNLQLTSQLIAGDKATFGGPYPLNDHNTGLNNSEWNGYPGGTNDRIYPVAHPLDSSRPSGVLYEVRPGDQQPHYPGSTGERSELWPEPHDGVAGTTDFLCASWVIPQGYTQMPSGWCMILQNHPGQVPAGTPIHWSWPNVNLSGGHIDLECPDIRKTFAPVQANREFFVVVESFLKSSGGYVKMWISWDKPPNTLTSPFLSSNNSETLYGDAMYWKTGIYRNTGESFTSRIIQTTFARRAMFSDAVVAAGWDKIGVVTPPPPPPPPTEPTNAQLRDQAVAALKQTTVGYINKHWKTPPDGTQWKIALDLLSKIK